MEPSSLPVLSPSSHIHLTNSSNFKDNETSNGTTFSTPPTTTLPLNSTSAISYPNMCPTQPLPSSHPRMDKTSRGLMVLPPSSLITSPSAFLKDFKRHILDTLPKDNIELYDPVILIDVPTEVQTYAELILGAKTWCPDITSLPSLTPESALYLFQICKYSTSTYKLSHPKHLPWLQILLRYQNPSNFHHVYSWKPKKMDEAKFFIHERILFETLSVHFRDPTNFIAFLRHSPVLYLGHYLLRSMVSLTRHLRDHTSARPSVVILWDGDNLVMPETFVPLLKKNWIQLHVHVLVHGQNEWQFIKKLPNAYLHISHRTFKEAVDYRILEQIKVNLPIYKTQSVMIVSRDRSFEIMAQLARDKLNTWVYRASKLNEVLFLLHWMELHFTNFMNLEDQVANTEVEVSTSKQSTNLEANHEDEDVNMVCAN